MKKITLFLALLFVLLSGIIYLGCKRGNLELYYVLPQAKSYVNDNEKMNFEIYSNTDDSIIKYSNKNTYNLIFDDSVHTLTNVIVDVIKQNKMYLYIIESDLIDIVGDKFTKQDCILQISNYKYSLSVNVGNLSILDSNKYKLLSINNLYGSYSYVNGSLELVGINIKFSNDLNKINNIKIGDYAVGDLDNILEYNLPNEINILDEIPNYDILKEFKSNELILNDKEYFIPITYPKLLTITKGYILIEGDNENYYLDRFSFIVNELDFNEYKNKMILVEVNYYDKGK